ncbi:MAG: OmpA family protein [Candidatus Krumholzibacteria bacterium]|nr:OmpA family protein [Candidatus Krumholzibacteria bacterium]
MELGRQNAARRGGTWVHAGWAAIAAMVIIVFPATVYASASYNGTRGLLRTKTADTIGKGNLSFQLGTHFQKLNDAKYFPDLGNPADSAIVDYMFFISRAGVTYGLNDYFEISGSLDVRSWVRTIQEQPTSQDLDTRTRGGLGDTDVSAKVGIPLPTDYLKIGGMGTFSFPTGSKERAFTTESSDILALGLATIDLSGIKSFVPTRFHVNAGYRWNRNEDNGYGIFDPSRPDTSGFNPPGYPATPDGEQKNYNDAFVFASAVEFPAPQVSFFVEFYWEKLLKLDIETVNAANRANNQLEQSENLLTLSPGVEFKSASGSGLKLGADINLNSGDKPAYTNPPDWGVWLVFSQQVEIVPRDSDRDGVKDKDDACPNQPEDADGFEDSDGCPDLDNDGDGIPDAQDACPDLAEDVDGYEDSDGCPDLDNDQDGIPDAQDRCPDEPEDFDGDQDTDGCPDLVKDSDGDGIADDLDRCPLQAEDIDGFQDDDGCPDLDNDLDGIPDDVDNCPNSPETFNGYQDEDGCPDEQPIEEKFVLRGVNFESGSAALTPDSYAVLDHVVRSLQAYPEVRVEIRGHTDSQGPASFNVELSQRRAESVKQYLINSGIDPTRLVSKGVGEEEPVASNANPEGRAQNRRIEFRRLN